ncbi:hemagglutinin-like protein [Trinickia symbiotica]|nr:hemagglutinin-like protein [Trinickia symbiotica]
MRGAVVGGRQVVANVGGNLTIESLQDTSTYHSKHESVSGSVTVGYGFSGSANYGQQKMDSDFASVAEQSGIKAGDGGFQIDVKGDTHLNGGVITSSEQAIADGLNSLTTATLSTSDIENRAEYSASGFALGGGYSSDGGGMSPRGGKGNLTAGGVGTNQQGQATTGGDKVPGSDLPRSGNWSAVPPVVMGASGDGSSTTVSGISGGAIRITDEAKQQALTGKSAEETIASVNRAVTTERDGANTLKPIFDEREIQAGFEIVGAWQRETGAFLANRAKEVDAAQAAANDPKLTPEERVLAQQKADDLTAAWGPGGSYRRVLTALTAAAGGNVTGGAEAFTRDAAVSYLQGLAVSEAKELANRLGEGTPEAEAARAALHAIVGCAGAAASTQTCNAGAMGAAASSVLGSLLGPTTGLSAQEKEVQTNLVTSFVAGVAGVMGDPVTAANAAGTEGLYNRQLNDEEREQAKRLSALAKERGLTYTEADIKNQQALMNLAIDGKTYYGDNQVATGSKPQDGTDWNYYGQNVEGESVWVQNVQRGDPDLQAFIANNTNGKTANGMTYEATIIGSNPGLFRLPDFVNFQVDYFVGSAWGSFSRDGNSYFGYGVNKALPNSVNASASAQFGWLNRSSVIPGETNKFLAGYAGSGTVAFSAVGGGVVYSPGNGTATVLGVGAGANLGKAKNPASTGMGYTVDKGKTGMEW